MNMQKIEDLKQKAMDLRYNNNFIKDINNNKKFLLEINTKEAYTMLAKNMLMKFNDQFVNIIDKFLSLKINEDKFIMNWLKNQYRPFFNKFIANLNISTIDKLIDLSVILDNQVFYLEKALDGTLAELKLAIYEVPDELKKKFKSSDLLLIEKQVEQHTVKNMVIEVWGNRETINQNTMDINLFNMLTSNRRFGQRRDWSSKLLKNNIKHKERNYNRPDWEEEAVIWKEKNGTKILTY